MPDQPVPDHPLSNRSITIPNIITVVRLVLVPVAVWAISDEQLGLAFWIFLIAGISDGIDGYIARRWNLRSKLGSYLDPIADKALLVSIYVTLGIEGVLPRWLVILVVSRDLLIVGGIVLSWVMGRPVEVKPIFVSKANTTAQIGFAAAILGSRAFHLDLGALRDLGIGLVGVLTVASGAAYCVQWLRAMSEGPDAAGPGAVGPRAVGPRRGEGGDAR